MMPMIAPPAQSTVPAGWKAPPFPPAKVLEGQVQMDRNFTLESWETDKGFVLSCQARPTTERLVVTYDER